MSYNDTFKAFLNEAQFTREMLGTGATQIRRANYATKGIYYQAFTSLSTGLERIGKICLMLDYYIDTKGDFPDSNYIKSYKHNISSIYVKSLDIIQKRSLKFDYLQDLNEEIHQNIINILSEFAQGDRYSNINIIVNSKRKKSDSMEKWYENVDKLLFAKHVSQKKKDEILKNAQFIHNLTQEFTLVHHISEDGSNIENVKDASFRAGMQEAIALYRQLYVLQIIRFWVELVSTLQYDAMEFGEDIPHLSEVFALFFNSDSYIKTRKTWEKQ